METTTLELLEQTHGPTEATIRVRVAVVRLTTAELDDGVWTSAMTDAQCGTYLRLSGVVYEVNLGVAA